MDAAWPPPDGGSIFATVALIACRSCGHTGAILASLPRFCRCVGCGAIARVDVNDVVVVPRPAITPSPRPPHSKGLKPYKARKRQLTPGALKPKRRKVPATLPTPATPEPLNVSALVERARLSDEMLRDLMGDFR